MKTVISLLIGWVGLVNWGKAQPDTTRLRLLAEQADRYMDVYDLRRLDSVMRLGGQLATRYPRTEQAGFYFHRKGLQKRLERRYQESLKYFRQAEALLNQTHSNQVLGRVLYGKAVVLADLGDNPKAVAAALRCMKHCQQYRCEKYVEYAYNLLSTLYEREGDTTLMRFYEKLYLQRRGTDESAKFQVLTRQADTYSRMGEPQKALQIRLKTLFLYRGNPQMRWEYIYTLHNTVLAMFKLGMARQTLPYIRDLFKASAQYPDPKAYQQAWSDMASFHIALGNKAKALAAAERMMQYAYLCRRPDVMLVSLQQLAMIQERSGNYRAALKTFQKFSVLKDSLQTTEKRIQIAKVQARYDIERKEAQIQLLTKKTQLQRLQAERQEQQLALVSWQRLLLGFSVLTAIGIIGLVTFFLHRANRLRTGIERQKEEIEQQAVALKEANQLKDRLFSVLSHDLRGPVASIRATLSLHRNDWQHTAGMNELEQQVVNLQQLLDNLLYWSINQRNGLRLFMRSVELKELVYDAIEAYSGMIRKKQLQLVVEGPDLNVHTDENLSMLVLRNLLHNALKFTPAHGKVCLITEKTETEVQLLIADTGVGMNPSLLGELKERGTGLGLPLSSDLMALCGGTLSVHSVVGVGTTVTLTWPVQDAHKQVVTGFLSSDNPTKY